MYFSHFLNTTPKTPPAPWVSSRRGITRHCFLLRSDASVSVGREEICKCYERAGIRCCLPPPPPSSRSPARPASRAPCDGLFTVFSFVFTRNLCSFQFFFSSLLSANLWQGQAAACDAASLGVSPHRRHEAVVPRGTGGRPWLVVLPREPLTRHAVRKRCPSAAPPPSSHKPGSIQALVPPS